MKQMSVPKNVSVLKRMPFGQIAAGFFRHFGRIFFAGSRAGVTYAFSVLENGTISRSGTGCFFDNEIVDVVHPENLGITSIVLA